MLREGWNFHNDIALRVELFARARFGISLEEVPNTIFYADMVEGGRFVECMICLLRNNFGYTATNTAVNEFIDKAAPFFNMSGIEMDSSTAQELLDEFWELMGENV